MQKQVLIVDDEEAVCQMVGKVLIAAGMESLALTSSSQALDLLNQEKFEMVFFDLHMASPDGMELSRHLRRSPWNRTTPIILISDDLRPSAMSVGFEAGANFFLYKPIDKERLLKLIRATQGTIDCGRRRTRRVALQSKVKLNSGADVVEGETIDVSLCGLLVKAGRSLARAAAREAGFVVAAESKDGTVLWLRKLAPDASTGTHQRMCLDSVTKSATVFWTNARGQTDSKTFRSVAVLREWLSGSLVSG